ncbi:MAG: hypothetical protein IKQ06_01640 [Bacilli bacterium]|nr:hypothetical protein [Bacilli bacterium]
MKAYKKDGLKIDLVDVDLDYLKEQMEEFVKKEQLDKASILKKYITALEDLEKEGKEITTELMENVVNDILDKNYEKSRKLKDEVEELEKENQLLSQYSMREMGNDTTTSTIISMINSL